MLSIVRNLATSRYVGKTMDTIASTAGNLHVLAITGCTVGGGIVGIKMVHDDRHRYTALGYAVQMAVVPPFFAGCGFIVGNFALPLSPLWIPAFIMHKCELNKQKQNEKKQAELRSYRQSISDGYTDCGYDWDED